ncbi:hypothetical protein TrRE_jg11292 [Triparma retinervis]|uniref:Uncharacterized protein n=1 Tax=Triparma retinervis TaxID=2557542 RepID=A0A9W7DPF8_9STRA|nr:hypothetical protein TrRE_jg11292 [Triparma retinervis]
MAPSTFMSPPRTRRSNLEKFSSPPVNRDGSPYFSPSKKLARTPPSILKTAERATYDSRGRNGRSRRYPHTEKAVRSKKSLFGHGVSSPLRDSSNSRSLLPSTESKKCSGFRLKWTVDTPTRNRRDQRVIRRLGSREKDRLYGERPDLDPSDGYFDMGAWMNGESQDDDEEDQGDWDEEDEESDEEEEEEEMLVSDEEMEDAGISRDSEEWEDAMENDENDSRNGSFLGRLMMVAGGK